MASAECPPLSVLKLRENVGVLFDEPGRNSGGGGAHNNMKALLRSLGNDLVKERKIILPLGPLHQVPGELGNADNIAAHFPDGLHIGLHQGGAPLFGVIIDA